MQTEYLASAAHNVFISTLLCIHFGLQSQLANTVRSPGMKLYGELYHRQPSSNLCHHLFGILGLGSLVATLALEL